eukprot:Seg10522.1 transcript_id=Seg10522.1/GoldUCD/mRNA.D3Y31 product="NADH dehydrogenase" protein_id=Seg10522.1/GoldUCD/D3Y31
MACRCMFSRPMQSLPVATRSLLQDFKAVRAGFDGTITKIQTSHLGHHYSSSQRQRCFTKLTGIDNIKNAIPLIRGWNIHQSQRLLSTKNESSNKPELSKELPETDNVIEQAIKQDETEGDKTKITVLNEEKNDGKSYTPYIYKYSRVGFTIGKNKVIGSVALLPGCILSCKMQSHHQITPESLSFFTIIHPRLEILVLGVGDKVVQLSPDVWTYLRQQKLPFEILDTPNACATYNFLTEEGRRTGAVLIPPQTMKI